MEWLPEPPPGTKVAGGFDGSATEDWTCIKLETVDGLLFTPRFGPNRKPTLWNPRTTPGGRVPRSEVHAAWAELIDRFDFTDSRVYYDPPKWETEGEGWALEYGDKLFVPFETYRPKPMCDALERFYTDLSEGKLRHDGCPVTTLHIGNARRVIRTQGRELYGLGRPSQSQKIDAGVTSTIAHLAACDARASGWGTEAENTVWCFR